MNSAAIVFTSLASTNALIGVALLIAWVGFGRERHAAIWAASFFATSLGHVCQLLTIVDAPGARIALTVSALFGLAGLALIAAGFLSRAGRMGMTPWIAAGSLALFCLVAWLDREPGTLRTTRMLLSGYSTTILILSAIAAKGARTGDRASGEATFWMLIVFAAYTAGLFVMTSPLMPAGTVDADLYRLFFLLGVPAGLTGAGLFAILLIGGDLAERLRQLASLDPLTGLLNRRGLDHAAERQIAQSRRGNRPIAVVVADLDRFKAINDRFGHARGDLVLKQFAESAATVLRAGDLLARLGGEEFVFVLPDSGAVAAREAMERVRARLSGALGGLVDPIAVTASFGIATLTGRGDTLQAMLARADAALYRSKVEGRDRISLAADGDIVAELRPRAAWRRGGERLSA